MTKITSEGWRLELDLNGGRIVDLTFMQERILGTYNRVDGKQGNTHICVPSFDKEGQVKYGLPFHGYARTLRWIIEEQTINSVRISAVTSSSVLYPASLKLTQSFLLQESMTHSVSAIHLSGEGVPVNIGIHYYWDTPKGWKNTKLNGTPITSEIETNGYVDFMRINDIMFPHAQYEVSSQEFNTAMVWTSFITESSGAKVYSQDFCCIEPIIGWPHFFGSDRSIVKPGGTVSASVRIRKVV